MKVKNIGKFSLYYGSGDAATERGKRMDAAAKRRGYVDKDGEPEISPLFVYAFELLDALDPGIEKEARNLGLEPWDYVNQLFTQAKKKGKAL